MPRVFQPLLFLLARCTRNELIRHIEFLKAENEILRSRIPQSRIMLKRDEKERLLKLGEVIGSKLLHLITIVRYDTFLRWRRNKVEGRPVKKVGRPKTSEEIRDLILKMAAETGWGYTRIMGELKKLGLKPPSKTTVKNILREAGHDPGPKRGNGTWEEFLKAHAETLWQCDFFSKRVLTRTGFRQAFVMAFINVATRRVIVSPSTLKLGDGWIVAETKSFFEQVQAAGLVAKVVMRDNEYNYRLGFDSAVEAHGGSVRPTALRAPNENAYVERFVQTIKQECLDHFLAFGQKHFDYLVREFVRYYHDCRPHQGLDNKVIVAGVVEALVTKAEQVQCESRLGGVLKTYGRAA
jgi:putative transposase